MILGGPVDEPTVDPPWLFCGAHRIAFLDTCRMKRKSFRQMLRTPNSKPLCPFVLLELLAYHAASNLSRKSLVEGEWIGDFIIVRRAKSRTWEREDVEKHDSGGSRNLLDVSCES